VLAPGLGNPGEPQIPPNRHPDRIPLDCRHWKRSIRQEDPKTTPTTESVSQGSFPPEQKGGPSGYFFLSSVRSPLRPLNPTRDETHGHGDAISRAPFWFFLTGDNHDQNFRRAPLFLANFLSFRSEEERPARSLKLPLSPPIFDQTMGVDRRNPLTESFHPFSSPPDKCSTLNGFPPATPPPTISVDLPVRINLFEAFTANSPPRIPPWIFFPAFSYLLANDTLHKKVSFPCSNMVEEQVPPPRCPPCPFFFRLCGESKTYSSLLDVTRHPSLVGTPL